MIIKPLLRDVKKHYLYWRYSRRMDSIRREVFRKEKINVVFFAVNVGMWKSDGLFRQLQADSRFNPVVVSFLLTHNSKEYWKKVQDEMRLFFTRKGYRYYDCYDFERSRWLDLSTLSPDIVLYAQQGNYNSSYQGYRIDALWKHVLFAYVPYCLLMERLPAFYNGLLTSICWKVFAPTTIHRDIYAHYSLSGGSNKVVTGCTFADDIAQPTDDCWKVRDRSMKRIIWAPHHSILHTDALNYSNFLSIADQMVELAMKYKDTLQIAFKPHPRLLDKLYKLEGWGVEKADSYYHQWATMPNTMYVSGNYVSLFQHSDAMIHDCSTFTGEYLYTGNPVLYLTKADHLSFMNEFGRLCFEQHYKGCTIDHIEDFIRKVVMDGDDPMKTSRQEFYKDYLMPPNSQSVAENMYVEFAADADKYGQHSSEGG